MGEAFRDREKMFEPKRISVAEVRRRMQADDGLMLVCAYDEDRAFQLSRIPKAIPFPEFQTRKASLPKDQGLVFY